MNSNAHLSLRTNGAQACLKSRFCAEAQEVPTLECSLKGFSEREETDWGPLCPP